MWGVFRTRVLTFDPHELLAVDVAALVSDSEGAGVPGQRLVCCVAYAWCVDRRIFAPTRDKGTPTAVDTHSHDTNAQSR